MYTLMWYMKEYVDAHPVEYGRWLKERGGMANDRD